MPEGSGPACIDALRARGSVLLDRGFGKDLDLLIGCTALARGDATVTGNVRRFDRRPGLAVHAWR